MIVRLDKVIRLHEGLIAATNSSQWPVIVDYLEWREAQEIEGMIGGGPEVHDLYKGRIEAIRALKVAGRAAPAVLERYRKEQRHAKEREARKRKDKEVENADQEGSGAVPE